MKYNKYVDNFVKVIRENIDSEDLGILDHNIESLRFQTKVRISNAFSRIKLCGEYNSKRNKITIYDIDESFIYHELLHMASSKYENGQYFEGFLVWDFGPEKKMLGESINEGYTELMARRLFNIQSKVCNGYEYQVYVAMLLEKIIGQDSMQKYYFNANLSGLIDALSLYVSKEDIISFIENLDYILESFNKTFIYFRKKNVCYNLTMVNKFLSVCYTKKMYKQYEDGLISREELLKSLYSFNDLLLDNEESENDYVITGVNDIYTWLSDEFGETDKDIVDDYKRVRINNN